MRIEAILADKGGEVIDIAPTATLTELTETLCENNIGAVVVREDARLVGIISERDIVHALHQHGVQALDLPVSDAMTSPPVTCSPRDSLHTIASVMTSRRIRHLPVVNGDQLAGILSIGDVVKARMQQLESEHQQLQDYIQS